MATRSSHNKNNSAVKRILQEARELGNDESTDYSGAPLEEDIFEWHCTIRGPSGTEFEGGLYHCRVLLPSEYPFRPPSVMIMTPNGRFELNKKICISFTSYHEELWQPAWGVRTAIVGLQGFFPTKGDASVGIGALEFPIAERKRLAAASREWVCPQCGVPNKELLPDPKEGEKASSSGAAVEGEHSQHVHFEQTPVAPAPAVAPGPVLSAIPSAVPSAIPSSAPATISGFTLENPAAVLPIAPEYQPASPSTPASATSATSAIVIPDHRAELAPLPSRPPLVLDGLIVLLVSIVVTILAKKAGVELWF